MSALPGDLPAWAVDLLESSRVARLGLRDLGGAPRVQPVTFAVAGGRLWSAVDHKRKAVPATRLARIRFLRADPRAALTVDRYEEDWGRLAWVQALGRVEIVDTGPEGAVLDALRAKYPQYEQTPPAGPVLALTVERWLHWRATP